MRPNQATNQIRPKLREGSSVENRILFVGEYGVRNGGENSWLAILPTLTAAGLRFSALVPSPSEFATALGELGVSVTNWELKDSYGNRKSQGEIRDELAEAFRRIRPNLIHANSLSGSRLIGPVSADARIASVGYIRDIIKLSKKAIEDLNQIDCLVAVSHATRDFHIAQGIDEDRICVNYNGIGIDERSLKPTVNSIHRELAIPETHRLVCCIGQFGMRKGLETTISAFLQIARQLSDVHLLLIGQRHSQKAEAVAYEQQLHHQSHNSPHSDRIHWLGRRNDALEILCQSSLLLHGARQEPLGRVLLEAAGSGIPFVATDVGGTSEIAGEQLRHDLVVTVDSPTQMAGKAKILLEDNEKWESTSQRLRGIATDVFSVGGCADRLLKLYHSLGISIPQKPDSLP